MGRLLCKCENIINIKGYTDDEYYLVRNSILLNIEEKLDENSIDGDEMSSLIISECNSALRCPKCKRIYLYDTIKGEKCLYIYNIEETITDENEEDNED